MSGEYRIAVNPGMLESRTDFYHVDCFEKIADFSQANFLDRLQPLSRNNQNLRGLTIASIMDGNNILDAKAELLTGEWKLTMGRLIDNLLYISGSAKYTLVKPPQMSQSNFENMIRHIATIESDGPEDSEEWNLCETFLRVSNDRPEDLNKRHSLSRMLKTWDFGATLATSNHLSTKGEEMKEEIGEKAIRGIKRLAAVHR